MASYETDLFISLFKYMVSVLYFHLLGPEGDQKKVEPHHTVFLDDGDCIIVENKVHTVHNRIFFH